jgi:endonuclease YncB( thermonuclease family)
VKHGFWRVLWMAVWAIALPASADSVRGTFIVVIDGDTVLFKPADAQHASRAFRKIRLADIDAPEKDQPYGEAATRAVSALLLHQSVVIDTVATDVYGRSVAYVQKDALQINTELVRLGLAWSSSRGRRSSRLVAAQDEARRARRGLWADAAPTPPWAWRRAQSAP